MFRHLWQEIKNDCTLENLSAVLQERTLRSTFSGAKWRIKWGWIQNEWLNYKHRLQTKHTAIQVSSVREENH